MSRVLSSRQASVCMDRYLRHQRPQVVCCLCCRERQVGDTELARGRKGQNGLRMAHPVTL